MDMAGMMNMPASGASTASSGGMSNGTGSPMDAMAGMAAMMGSGSCKISMLWNWYTIDACFLAESWHITSKDMFAGSCIGVIVLVMTLEGLRRAAKEYDAYLIRKRIGRAAPANNNGSERSDSDSGKVALATTTAANPRQTSFRPTLLEQIVRALLHMVQFAVAYFVMLLAMYFNGYIIICIFIGAFLGAFTFNWTNFNLGGGEKEEVTVCCG